ncbi:DUF6538 domain-containing protein [Chitinibacter sp. FCG-7]|uniref:DUF6538 domain-containing protein n=1 Tax=Chitinibacter mangrovi TaxID=3153927 RepID=A0AAU7F8V3_9NEIS
MAYLIKRDSSYYLRIRIPLHLQAQVGKKILWKSLKTSSPRLAQQLCIKIVAKLQLEFAAMAHQNKTLADFKRDLEAADDLKQAQHDDEWNQWVVSQLHTAPDTSNGLSDEDWLAALNPPSPEESALAEAMIEAELRAQQLRDLKAQAKFEGYQEALASQPATPAATSEAHQQPQLTQLTAAVAQLAEMQAQQTIQTTTTHTLRQLFVGYRAEKLERGAWREKSEGEFNADMALFLDILGDLPLNKIDRSTALSLLNQLKKVPKNRKKMPAFRNKSLQLLWFNDFGHQLRW